MKPLFSLWELMEEFQVNLILSTLYDVKLKRATLEKLRKVAIVPESVVSDCNELFEGARSRLKRVDFPVAQAAADCALQETSYHPKECDVSSLLADLRHIEDGIYNDFWGLKVISVDPKGAQWVNNDALFGATVKDSFPSASADIKEAGNCLAVGCDTACVFHLMRVAEIGLRALAYDRRVTIPKGTALEWATWEEIIKELEKAEDAIRNYPKTPARNAQFDFVHGAMMQFKRFKNKFRNNVMHTRDSYDHHAANNALDNVAEFMNTLAPYISEGKRTPVIWKRDPSE